jgi:hypothetical protein
VIPHVCRSVSRFCPPRTPSDYGVVGRLCKGLPVGHDPMFQATLKRLASFGSGLERFASSASRSRSPSPPGSKSVSRQSSKSSLGSFVLRTRSVSRNSSRVASRRASRSQVAPFEGFASREDCKPKHKKKDLSAVPERSRENSLREPSGFRVETAERDVLMAVRDQCSKSRGCTPARRVAAALRRHRCAIAIAIAACVAHARPACV